MPNKAPYRISGLVEDTGELQTFAKGFSKRTLVIVDDPDQEYPNYAAIEYVKDKTQLIASLRKGERVTATFWPEAHAWTDPKTGKVKWFSSLRGSSLTSDGMGANSPVEPDAEPEASGAEEADSDAELPF